VERKKVWEIVGERGKFVGDAKGAAAPLRHIHYKDLECEKGERTCSASLPRPGGGGGRTRKTPIETGPLGQERKVHIDEEKDLEKRQSLSSSERRVHGLERLSEGTKKKKTMRHRGGAEGGKKDNLYRAASKKLCTV